MFVTNWISTTKIQKISEITNFFRHYFLSRTEVKYIHRYVYHNATHPLPSPCQPNAQAGCKELDNSMIRSLHPNLPSWEISCWKPTALLVIVLIYKIVTTCIVRRIYIDTFHLFCKFLSQKIESLKILRTNHQTITLFIKMINGSKQLVLKLT